MAHVRDNGRTTRYANGRRCSNDRFRYGALNAIGGFSRDARYMILGDNSHLTDPIYRGPCPPNPDGTDLENVYGSFYQEGELTVSESTPTVTTPDGAVFRRVEMNATNLMSEEGLVKERTRLLILDPGIYFIRYDFSVPEEASVSTTLSLLYNRERIPASSVNIQKSADDPALNVSGHALIEVDANGAEIILGSTGLFSLTPDTFESIVSMTVFSIA